jgi:lipoprotein-anchoring transpeptidase ErfK/SrfK
MTLMQFRRAGAGALAVAFLSGVAVLPGASSVSAGSVSTPTTQPPTDRLSASAVAPKAGTKPLVLEPVSNLVHVPAGTTPLAAVGSKDGAATTAIQQRLLELGFWLRHPDGTYDITTRQAVMAFQKFIGLDVTGEVDIVTASFLQFTLVRGHGKANSGTLVEVDKAKQLMFIVRNGKALWTMNISTGSGVDFKWFDPQAGITRQDKAITPEGLFATTRERANGWWTGDLGKIYRPKYFSGGIAIHGMTSVPAVPASHGCVRVGLLAMDFIWDSALIPLHTPVWVHQ